MIRKLFLLLILYLGFNTHIFACDIKIISFGSEKEKMNLSMNPEIFPDQFGGENLLIPINEICKTEESLFGSMINYLFVNNKLLQITLMRANLNDARLLDFAMDSYGEFSLPSGIKKQNFRGNHVWEKGNENINYVHTNIHDGEAEFIEITNDLYLLDLEKYNQKIGKWLDSQE